MTKLRLIADDLTGALDSAAQFAGLGLSIPVFPDWGLPASLPEEFAVDASTREADSRSAEAVAARLAPLLSPAEDLVAFKKVDSLLRGHPALELAATLMSARVRNCVIAPAFPFHARVTRGGLQYAQRGGVWHRVGEDLAAALESLGFAVAMRKPGERAPEGVSLWDAESDLDLGRVAAAGRELTEGVLWCGSAGLAAALSGSRPPIVPVSSLGRPLLGIVGSGHAVAAAQLGACGGDVFWLGDRPDADMALVSERLGCPGACLVGFDLPPGLSRRDASERIARLADGLTRRVMQPLTLLVVGGETLRDLCRSLGAGHLAVSGEVVPGVPVSLMVGGRWGGTRVVSKSGAFGDDGLLKRIVSDTLGHEA